MSVRGPTDADARAKAASRAVWETDRAALLFQRPFVATLALRMPLIPVVDHRVPTACTDGASIWFNPYFLDTLTPPERVFVLAHEIWHCVMLHPLRRGDRVPDRWNLAVDQEVNALLRQDGWKMPAGAFYDEDYEGLAAEAIYERLPPGPSDARSLDEHLEPRAGGLPCAAPGRGTDADADRVEDPDFDPPTDTRNTWDAWPGRVTMTANQLRARGKLSVQEDRVLSKLGDGRLDWRRLLRDFVTRTIGGDRAWHPPARRHVHRGLYLPSLREPKLQVTVAVDTSGSVHGALRAILGELCGLLSSFGRWSIDVLWADDAVRLVETWTSDDPPDLDRLKVRMGGGTDFRPVFQRLAADPPPLLIYVTDGCGPAPELPPPWPVLWVLVDPENEPPARWGECTWMDAQEGT